MDNHQIAPQSLGMTRAFLAIPIPDTLRQSLARLQSELTVGRLVEPENFHITLQFLDAQPEPVLRNLHEVLCDLHMPPFDLQISGPQTFGGDSPRIIFAQVEPSSALSRLQKKLRRAAMDCGIVLHHERYHPHVTLARLGRFLTSVETDRVAAFLEASAGFRPAPFTADSYALYQSVLHPDGPIYTELARYPLTATP